MIRYLPIMLRIQRTWLKAQRTLFHSRRKEWERTVVSILEASGSFDDNLADDFFTALEEEDCKEMFCNYQGIMLGETGQVCKWALK